MEFLEPLNTLVETAGFMGAVILLLIILVITTISMFTKRISSLTDAITTLTDKVSRPYLDVAQSLFVYRAVSSECISRMLAYIGEVLDRNSIHERRFQIEQNIKRELAMIQSDEGSKLSSINSVCGDMGQILLTEMKWDEVLPQIYETFFSNDPIKNKIQDIKILLKGCSDNIAGIIQLNGIHNK